MKLLDWLIYTLIAIAIVGGLWWYLGKNPAEAQEYHTVRVCAWYNWDGSCHYTYQRRRYRASREPTRVYSYERRESQSGPRCEDPIAVTGDERYGSQRAKEAADTTWAERAKFLFGVRYMDLKNARHLSYECNRSSTGKRASEGAAAAVGQVLEQCELRATPCRAERETTGDR